MSCDPPDSQPCRFETERLSRRFDPVRLQHRLGVASVSKHRQSAQVGDHRAQEFKPLGDKVGLLDRHSGNVATWLGQALNKAATNRIEGHSKDDRNGRCRLL